MSISSADLLLFRAVQQIEEESDPAGAIATLEECIELCEVAGHALQLIRARFLLGQILAALEQLSDAREEFTDVVTLAENYSGDAAEVDEELAAAKVWLAENHG